MSPRLLAIVTTCAAVALFGVGCSSDDSASGSSTSKAAPEPSDTGTGTCTETQEAIWEGTEADGVKGQGLLIPSTGVALREGNIEITDDVVDVTVALTREVATLYGPDAWRDVSVALRFYEGDRETSVGGTDLALDEPFVPEVVEGVAEPALAVATIDGYDVSWSVPRDQLPAVNAALEWEAEVTTTATINGQFLTVTSACRQPLEPS